MAFNKIKFKHPTKVINVWLVFLEPISDLCNTCFLLIHVSTDCTLLFPGCQCVMTTATLPPAPTTASLSCGSVASWRARTSQTAPNTPSNLVRLLYHSKHTLKFGMIILPLQKHPQTWYDIYTAPNTPSNLVRYL